MQGGAYVSIYLHPIDYAGFSIRQVEEAQADRKTRVRIIGIDWLRDTSKQGRLEPSRYPSSRQPLPQEEREGATQLPHHSDPGRKYAGASFPVMAAL